MTTAAADRTREIMHSADDAAWSSAALVIALSGDGPAEWREAATGVLRSLGVDIDQDSGGLDRLGIAAQAAAPLLQATAVIRGTSLRWADQPDDAVIAQGRASAQGAAAFRQFGLPMLTGLAEAMDEPGAKMLDVGTGVAALAVAYAELFPALTVVGLDVLPRVLELAAETVRASDVADRIELRNQDVTTLADIDTFALAFLPAPFLPQAALVAGAHRIAQALVPGGWLMLAHGKFGGDPVQNALTRFKTVAYGGTALNDDEAQSVLRAAGLINIMSAPTPPGAPAITVGRKTSR